VSKPTKLDVLVERDFGIMTGKQISDVEKLCAPDIIKAKMITYSPYANPYPSSVT
jgi:hypothetical protein